MTSVSIEPSPRQPVDTIVTGHIVTMDTQRRLLPQGAIAIHNGTILAVGEEADILAQYEAKQQLGDRHTIVLPGLIDCHNHAAQSLVRSLIAEELPMIYRLYLPAEDAMTLDDVRVSARLCAAQLLRSGVTTFTETTVTTAHEEVIVEVIQEVGIRCCMARGAGDQDFCHAAVYSQITDHSWIHPRPGEGEQDLQRTEAFLNRYDPSGRGLIKGSVLASHLTAYSADYFQAAAALARQYNTSLQVHVARDREEVEFSLAVFGCTPIQRLAELGIVDDHLLAIHAILANEQEIALLGKAHAAIAHSPIECLNIFNGVPNIAQMRISGMQAGLGCDNALNDMFEVMRAAWLIHGALRGIPTYNPRHLTAEDILEMATIGGAKAIRWSDRIGSLEVGKAADLVMLDGRAAHLFPIQNLPTELVRYASRADVASVMVNGQLLIDNRQYTTLDLEKLAFLAESGAQRIRAAIAHRRYTPLRVNSSH